MRARSRLTFWQRRARRLVRMSLSCFEGVRARPLVAGSRWHDPCSSRVLMEMFLQRYSWTLNLVAVLLGTYLAARTLNTLAGAAITPKPSLLQQASAVAPLSSGGPQRVELDAGQVAPLFDVPLPHPPQPRPPIGPPATAPPRRNPA